VNAEEQWEADYLAACKRRCRLYSAPYVYLATQLGEPAAIALAPLVLPALIEASWSEADERSAQRYRDAIEEKYDAAAPSPSEPTAMQAAAPVIPQRPW
jgi:hypothetical protein